MEVESGIRFRNIRETKSYDTIRNMKNEMGALYLIHKSVVLDA